MTDWKLGAVEARFADIIWQNEPLSTQELTRLCEQELKWKRTTTYTVLGRLTERGLFKKEGTTVSSCLTREEFYARQSRQYVEDAFADSLPAFLAAFTTRKGLTAAEVEEIRHLIDTYKEG